MASKIFSNRSVDSKLSDDKNWTLESSNSRGSCVSCERESQLSVRALALIGLAKDYSIRYLLSIAQLFDKIYERLDLLMNLWSHILRHTELNFHSHYSKLVSLLKSCQMI